MRASRETRHVFTGPWEAWRRAEGRKWAPLGSEVEGQDGSEGEACPQGALREPSGAVADGVITELRQANRQLQEWSDHFVLFFYLFVLTVHIGPCLCVSGVSLQSIRGQSRYKGREPPGMGTCGVGVGDLSCGRSWPRG